MNLFNRLGAILIASVLVVIVTAAVANVDRSTDASYSALLAGDANSAANLILTTGSVPPINQPWSVADPALQKQYGGAPTLTVTSYSLGPPTKLTILAKVGRMSQSYSYGQ